MPVRGKRSNTLQRYDLKPEFMPIQKGELVDERQDVRQEIPHRVHDVDRGIAVLDADVHVQPEDQVGARDELHVLDYAVIALVGINLLQLPVGKRMGAARRQQHAVLAGQRDHSRGATIEYSRAPP